MVRQAPLGHDRATARDDARDALGSQGDIGQPHPGMDGEIVHALLGLFDQGVFEDFPGQVLGDAIDLFQRLIDRHCADGHGAVTDHPVADIVDVAARRQVHDRVTAPTDGPDHLVDLIGHRGKHGGVSDIGVDLDQEIAADDHRLQFAVVDIGRDDGPPACDFLTDKFWGDVVGDRGPEIFAVADDLGQLFAAHVLADGDIFHLGGDDPSAGIGHLGHSLAVLGLERLLRHREGRGQMDAARMAIVLRLYGAWIAGLDVAAGNHPRVARTG